MTISHPLSVVFFGISGAGKGTQAELLEKYLMSHDAKRTVLRPEMGSMARAFIESGSTLSAYAKRIVETGGLLPSFVPIFLMTKFFNENYTGSEHILLDGVARRTMQSQAIDEILRFLDRKPLVAILLEVSRESAKKRLLERGRSDDVDEVIEQRFTWYEREVVPACLELEKLGWNVVRIDGEPDIQTIHKNILSVLELPQ